MGRKGNFAVFEGKMYNNMYNNFFTRSKTIYQHIREGSCFLGSLVRKFIKVKKSNGVCLQKIMRFEIMSNEIGI